MPTPDEAWIEAITVRVAEKLKSEPMPPPISAQSASRAGQRHHSMPGPRADAG